MKKRLLHRLLPCLLFLIGLSNLFAQQDPAASQRSYTTSQGARASAIGNLKSFVTVGQQATGISASTNLVNRVGFIYTLGNNCPKPFAVKAANITNIGLNNNSAEISWSVPGSAAVVEVRYKPEGVLDWTTLSNVIGTSLQLDGLLDGLKYQLQVRTACGGNFFSAYSDLITFTTQGPPPCPVPASLLTTSISPNEQKIDWSSTGAISHELRYRLKGTLLWSVNSGINANTFNLSGLESGMTYQYQVRSLCTNLQSVFSDLNEFTTQGAPSCETPTALKVASLAETTANLQWTHPGADAYAVRYRLKTSVIWITTTSASTDITLTGLEPGMPYIFSVQAVCNQTTNLRSPFADIIEFQTIGIPSCAIPSGITSVPATDFAAINWSAAEGAVLYDIRYRVEGTAVWTNVQATATGLELSNLVPGTAYQLQARSICNASGTLVSQFTPASSFTTQGLPVCDTPSALTATAGTSDAILGWSSSSGAVRYEIRYRVEGTLVWKVVTSTSNQLTISPLESGTPYVWSVRSICNENATLVSPFSSNSSFTTQGTISCEIPSAFVISDLTDNSARVSWTGSNALSYLLRYRLNGTTIWNTVTTTLPEAPLNALEPGMSYQYQVRSVCNEDGTLQSLFSEVGFFQTKGLVSCAVPTGLTASGITTTSATPGWGQAEGAIEYEFRYRIKGTTIWNTQVVINNQVPLTGLESGMTYQYAAKSNCKVDPPVTSLFSEIAEFTLLGTPSCEVPDGFSISATDNDADISWNDKQAGSYELRYRVSGSTIWTSTTVSSNSVSLGSLYSNTQYQLQVRSVCAADGSVKSAFSDVEIFETTGTISCEVPVISSVVPAAQSASIGWSGATGAQQYDVRYRVKGTTLWSQVITSTPGVELTGLSSGMPYQFRVRTLCSQDQSLVSAYSPILEFITTGPVSCAVPADLVAKDISFAAASLEWASAGGALKYEVQFRKQGDILWNVVLLDAPQTGTPAAGTTVGSLSSASTYQWKVRTLCSADNSLSSIFSTVSYFTTLQDPAGTGRDVALVVQPSFDDAKADSNILEADALFAYPNPADEQVLIKIRVVSGDRYMVVIHDLTGIQIAQLFDGRLEQGEERDLALRTAMMPSGLYVVRMVGEAGTELNRKLIITH